MNPKLRILVVDDDRRMTRTLADILSLQGYEIAEAGSAAEAIELARTAPFDCVLTDVRMPGMNGVELHLELQKLLPGLPVALMTAYSAEEVVRRGRESGVVSVLSKPLDINQALAFFASLARSRTITVVDDDPAFCQTLGDILERRGYQVVKVTDPHQVLQHVDDPCQVLLLDMKLNSINGYDVLREVRARCPDMPVLLITGYRQEMTSAIQKALDIHAYACLYKPLIIPDLLAKLGEVRIQRLRQALDAKQG
ncbi:MAG: response regulator [Chloroflexi bacterium]|nr:response regulator [Chloroflexota bacterium]